MTATDSKYQCLIYDHACGEFDITNTLYMSKYRIMYVLAWLFMRSREGYFGVYFPSCVATREINTKITIEWAHKQFATRVHTLFYFLQDITNP